MSKYELSNLNGIIVLINGKPITNNTLKNDIDRLIIMRNEPKLFTKAHNYIKILISTYYKTVNDNQVEFIETIKEMYPNGRIKKVINKQPLNDLESIEIDINDLKDKTIELSDLDKRFKENQQKLRELKKKLGIKPKIKTEKQKTIRHKTKLTHKEKKPTKELSYKDIKPYLTKRQLNNIKETSEKDGVVYLTKLLTQDKEYFDKQLYKEKFDSTTKYLGNKHIKTQIGLVYRLFVSE